MWPPISFPIPLSPVWDPPTDRSWTSEAPTSPSGLFRVEARGPPCVCRSMASPQPEPPLPILGQRLEPVGFLPLLSSPREILILPMPAGVQRGVTEKPWPQILLFVITIFTTLFVGALGQGADPFSDPTSLLVGL